MIYTGSHLLKEKVDLAFDEEIADIKEHIEKNEKISLLDFVWGFFLHFIDEVVCCGYYSKKKTSSNVESALDRLQEQSERQFGM